MDVREKLEVIAHLGDHVSYKEDIGICYDSELAKVIEDAYMTLKNGVTVQEWISVKDRLPENDYGTHWKERPHYLVCLDNGLMMVATFGFKEYAWWIDSHSCVLSKEHYREVTHWMPLPQPPKGE